MPELKRAGQPAIHYEVDDYTDPWKRAPVMLLQHGFARSHRVWLGWVPYLSRFYKVVRADLRGMGLSSRDFDLKKGISLEAYFGEPPDERALATLRLFRFVSDLREAMWGTVQSVLSDVDFDFRSYAARHFERAEERRNDPRFEAWLERVRGGA